MQSFQRYNILIDSAKRQNKSESSTNFSVNLTNGYNVKMARLKSIMIPLTFYNITTNNNYISCDFLDLSDGSHNTQFTITPGRYSVETLIDAINLQFTTLPAPYGYFVLSFCSENGAFTFTATDNVNIVSISNTQLCRDLGIEFIYAYKTGPIITSTLPSIFINTNYLKLSINNLNSNLINIDNNQNNTTFFIELDTDHHNDFYGKKILLTNPADDTGCKNNVYSNPVNLQNFKINITDRNNNILNLNGVDWWCLIEVLAVENNEVPTNNVTPFVPPNNQQSPEYMNKSNLPFFMRF